MGSELPSNRRDGLVGVVSSPSLEGTQPPEADDLPQGLLPRQRVGLEDLPTMRFCEATVLRNCVYCVKLEEERKE